MPVVVKGTAVNAPAEDFGSSPRPVEMAGGTRSGNQGQMDPPKSGCKDPIFAVLFYVNLFAILGCGIVFGPDAFSDDATYEYNGYIYATVVAACLSLLFSAGGLAVLMCIPELMIKVSLIFVVVVSGVWMVLSFLSGNIVGGIFGLIFFAISVCYARAVWSR